MDVEVTHRPDLPSGVLVLKPLMVVDDQVRNSFNSAVGIFPMYVEYTPCIVWFPTFVITTRVLVVVVSAVVL